MEFNLPFEWKRRKKDSDDVDDTRENTNYRSEGGSLGLRIRVAVKKWRTLTTRSKGPKDTKTFEKSSFK